MTRKFTVRVSVDAGTTGSNHVIEGTNLGKIIEQTCDYLGSLDEANERTLAQVVEDILKRDDIKYARNAIREIFNASEEEFKRGWDRKATGFRLSDACKALHSGLSASIVTAGIFRVMIDEYNKAQEGFAPKNAPKGFIPVEPFPGVNKFENLEEDAEERIRKFKSSPFSGHIRGKNGATNEDDEIVSLAESDKDYYHEPDGGLHARHKDEETDFFKGCKEELRKKFKGYASDIGF